MKTTNKITTATTPNATVDRFDTMPKYGVGQFLRAHPEAAKVMARMRGDSRDFFSITARARWS